jgi:hypothetical protein
MWPSILVPIVLFFALSVFVSSAISGMAVQGIQKK